MSVAPGFRLHDRFTLREPIGVGGMSHVWRAEDGLLDRPVAVKLLTSGLARDPLQRAAIWTEARAAARLVHPHVTQVYDCGETSLPDGTVVAYLVMELVDGYSLADRLRHGPLPWQQAVAIGAQVAAALAAAHRVGLVHRDVKPGNVMLTQEGAKLLDFGIAALSGAQPDSDAGQLVGTPAYAAPERVRPGTAAAESDVYALGALLYETLTGRPPMAVTSWRQAAAAHQMQMTITPPNVPGLPRRVSRLCLDCLSPDPAQRPTAGELAHDLATAAGMAPPAGIRATMGREQAAPSRGYAVGSASASASDSPTVIEPASDLPSDLPSDIAPDSPLDSPSDSRLSRPMLFALVGGAVVLFLALAMVASTLLSGSPARTTLPELPPSTDTTTTDTTTTTTTTTPETTELTSTTPSPVATPTTAQSVVDQLEAVVAEALAAGRIDSNVANELRDRIENLRNTRAVGKVHRAAQELERRTNDLVAQGELDKETANQLTGLLQPLLGGG